MKNKLRDLHGRNYGEIEPHCWLDEKDSFSDTAMIYYE